jgi:PhnB protein
MPTPKGLHTITPYVVFQDAAAAIDFYKRAFSAEEVSRHLDPSGRIMHAEIRIGDSMLMLTEESPAYPEMKSVQARGGSPVHLFLYLDDVDSFAAKAVAAGASVIMELANKEYGRTGGLKDPFGLTWWITTAP